MDDIDKYKFTALCPPNEDQWKKIYNFVYVQNYFHWKHYLLMSKLPYAHAIVCTKDESDEYIGLVIFIQPETINISYLGNYFVSEQYRGKGIGGRIWKLMMEHTDNSRVVVLGSFEAMVPKYRARDTPVPGTILERIHGDTARLKSALNTWISKRKEIESDYHTKDIDTKETVEAVLSFDKKIAHFDRSAFLTPFFPLADHKKAIFDSDGRVTAISATFPLYHEKNYKIGPVYAENFSLALLVLHALIQDVTTPDFTITIPDESESGQQLMKFLVNEANCTIGSKIFKSYSREFECSIEWSKVYAVFGHIASSLF